VAVTFRATAASGSVADTATVAKAVDVNGDVAEETSATDVTVGTYVPSSLSVTKTANPVGGTILAPGQTITYRLGYANSSPATMPAAALVDHLPSSVTYQTGSLVLNGVPISDMGNYTPGTRTIDVALGSVGPGVSGTLTFRVTVGPWAASRAGIRNAGLWTSGGSVVATTQPVYHYVDSLDITKSVANMSGKVVRTGSVLKWTIVITNRGIVPATHVVASDKIPLNTTYVKGSVTGLGSDVSQLPTLVWHVGTIGVGKSVTLTFKSTINSNVNNGVTIWNRAWSRADQSPTKGSTTVGGAVNDSTTVVVQTTGDENATIGLVAVLAALATGFMWVGRPGSGFIAKRGSRITAAVLVGAALVTGGMEVGAALGLPLPSPGEAMVSAAQATPAAAAAGRTVNGYAVSGRVILPTVHIDQRLVEGASAHALTAGLWHQPPSLKPGSAGTCVIAGHRISSQFSRLSGVKIGDRVWVASGGVSYKYRVTYVGTLRADGPTLGFRTGASERLILYTCIPRWAGDKRTVVVCNRTSK
jgi:LPXTG-site transpeptidase (sortase) family protein